MCNAQGNYNMYNVTLTLSSTEISKLIDVLDYITEVNPEDDSVEYIDYLSELRVGLDQALEVSDPDFKDSMDPTDYRAPTEEAPLYDKEIRMIEAVKPSLSSNPSYSEVMMAINTLIEEADITNYHFGALVELAADLITAEASLA